MWFNGKRSRFYVLVSNINFQAAYCGSVDLRSVVRAVVRDVVIDVNVAKLFRRIETGNSETEHTQFLLPRLQCTVLTKKILSEMSSEIKVAKMLRI